MSVSKVILLAVAVYSAYFSGTRVGWAASPEETVKSYVLADLEGERLSFKERSTTRSVITWKNEPGWDMAFVADKLEEVSLLESRGSTAKAEARISVIGIFSGESLLDVQFHEVVTFTLESKSGEWKIAGPVVPPHVKPRVLSEHLRQLAKDETGGGGVRSKTLIDLANSVEALPEQE